VPAKVMGIKFEHDEVLKRIATLSKELSTSHLVFNTSLEGTLADGLD
jgi:hypothetical protein